MPHSRLDIFWDVIFEFYIYITFIEIFFMSSPKKRLPKFGQMSRPKKDLQTLNIVQIKEKFDF